MLENNRCTTDVNFGVYKSFGHTINEFLIGVGYDFWLIVFSWSKYECIFYTHVGVFLKYFKRFNSFMADNKKYNNKILN